MKEPAEPDTAEPELALEPEESSEVKDFKAEEATIEFKEPEESPLEPEDESHGVSVVVGVSVGTGGGTVVATPVFFLFSSFVVGAAVVASIAPTTPPTIAAPAAATPTPMPASSAIVKPFARPMRKLSNTAARNDAMSASFLSCKYK